MLYRIGLYILGFLLVGLGVLWGHFWLIAAGLPFVLVAYGWQQLDRRLHPKEEPRSSRRRWF